MQFSQHFAHRAQLMKPAAIREVLNRSTGAGFISFTAGNPAPALFPLQAVYEQTAHLLEKRGAEAMQYASTVGFEPLRAWIANRQPPATSKNVLMVSGSLQAIDLTGKLFFDPGDKVAVSAPTYTTALSTWGVYGVKFLAVESDQKGMVPDSLERALQQGPKLLYCIPNFMNPTGVHITLERRQAIISLAKQYNVPILEDDPYAELRFEGQALPSLYELAPEQVIYAGSFSKTIAPGFRLGWIVADEEVIAPMTIAKQSTDLQTSTYIQMLVYEMLESGLMEGQIERVRRYYHRQRDLLLAAMQRYFPPEIKYDPPAGGMFVWCELPEHLDASEVLELALQHKVAYVPGQAFFCNGEGKNTLRLSYSLVTEREIEVGIQKLGDVFRMALQEG